MYLSGKRSLHNTKLLILLRASSFNFNSVKNFGIPKIGKGMTPLCVATLRLWLYSFCPPSHKTTVGICHSKRLWRPGSGGNV